MNNSLSLNPVLTNFSPNIREIIKNILTDVDFGVSAQRLKINTGSYKISPNEYIEKYIDSFILEIPYAGKCLEWEIIFKEEDYTYAPDIDFINDLFLFDPDIDIISDNIPSLANWNITDSKCLNSVIRELLKLYKEYQEMRLHTENCYSRLSSEYQDLVNNSDIPDTQVELYIDNGGAVHLLIGITVDFSCLPPYIQSSLDHGDVLNPHKDLAKLKVSFVKPDCSKVQNNLQLSPHLEQTIGSASKLRIPIYKKETTLEAYVADITKLLKDRVEQIANHHKMKSEFITALVARCGLSMVEYDNLLFSKATLLFDHNNVYALVTITLGDKFPQEKPKITLNSIYNLKNDKPYSQNLDSCPYSPRWKCDEIIKRLLAHLQEQIPQFHAVAQQHFSI
ncbi:hypothetical protein RI129_000354 [Pyrocoelia pectoralis]|uniref:BRISC and BRCA1-A complex member 2 n=1 Tax=Pyrocoelia pectoralis TaxID=417401 RepID=A0AAN7ZJ92_9COLE